MSKIDMSPKAVTKRLRRVDELRDLCRTLAGPRLKYPQHSDIPTLSVREHARVEHDAFSRKKKLQHPTLNEGS